MSNYITIDRDQTLLLPPDIRDWVPKDDLVHFIITAVDSMDSSLFRLNKRARGCEEYPPPMMLSLLIYSYANGIFSSRKIERATYRDIGVRYLTGNTHPDHDTICKFRRDNFNLVAECFVKVLELARELGVLRVGKVSVDGTKLKANASKYKNVRYDRAGELIVQLKLEVQELLDKAEQQDREDSPDGQNLPEELSHKESLKRKLEAARKRIESRAQAQAEAERAEYESKVQRRDSRKGRSKGKQIKKPKPTPEPKTQDNLTDPDSRLMRKNKRNAFEQSFNGQAVVDADGSQLILGTRITQCPSDRNELVHDIQAIPESIGCPEVVLADNGYLCESQVAELQEKQNIEVYVSVGSEDKYFRRKHDFRPSSKKEKKPPRIRSTFVKAMKEKMCTEKAKEIYRLRKQTVEPVFGIIKKQMGFNQFFLRGLEKVNGEWKLIALAYNFKRLWNIQLAES